MDFDYHYSITLAIYFICILAIAYGASKVTSNLSDYVLGGRSLNSATTALGAGASDMSGWLLLGLPGAVYTSGISEIWMPVGLVIGAYCNWFFVAKRLRVYTEVAKDSLTIPAYFDNRFQDCTKILRSVTALTIVVFFTFYAAAGFVGGALLFQAAFGIKYELALWIGAAVLITYTALGGFLAVNWVDLLQGTLMLFALLIVPISVIYHLGDWGDTIRIIRSVNPNYTDVFWHSSPIAVVSLLAWGLGYFGQPHILVRFMAARRAKDIPMARRICMSWMILSLVGAIFTGFVGIALFSHTTLGQPEAVFLRSAMHLFNPWMVGILFAAVLSAIMSTIAAQLLASSSALTEDFYHTFFRKDAGPKESVWVGRITVIIVALLAVYFAQDPQNNILNLVGYAWAGLGASFGPVILFSLYWPRMTSAGAIAGIVVGGTVVIVWNLLEHLGGIFHLYEIVPGFLLNCLAIYIVSLLTKQDNAEIAQQFEKVKQHLNDNSVH